MERIYKTSEAKRARERARYAKRADALKEYSRVKYSKESEVIKARVALYRKNNAEKHLQCSLNWQRNNPDKAGANRKSYRAQLKLATPQWLRKDQLKEMRALKDAATFLSSFFYERLDTDHIIPIRGKDVCGLHVPWNIQIIPKSINCSKGNR